MKNWRVVYTMNGEAFRHDFDTFDEACAWLSTTVAELKTRVTRVQVLERMGGEWARRHMWEAARE